MDISGRSCGRGIRCVGGRICPVRWLVFAGGTVIGNVLPLLTGGSSSDGHVQKLLAEFVSNQKWPKSVFWE